MAKEDGEELNNKSVNLDYSTEDKSFVKKVRSRVSGLFNSSISRLFGSNSIDDSFSHVRRREADEDEESMNVQPPCKRAKLPASNNLHNNFSSDAHHFINQASSNINRDSKNIFTPFPEPVAGPSGLSSRKAFTSTFVATPKPPKLQSNRETGLDKDSDSGESTSGYSSNLRIGNKEKPVEVPDSSKASPSANNSIQSRSLFNPTSAMSNRSLFTDTSLSPQRNSSMSSRRPSFNASIFGSPSFVDRTVSTSRIINSPFYNGRTIYGGASAYGRKLNRNPTELRKSIRSTFQVKPVNNEKPPGESTSLSKTARRILSTLEQYSTPLTDVKKIPLPTKSVEKKQGLLSKYTGANPYNIRNSKSASNRELQVPTVAELLQMKQKQRLQDSTVSVRQIATGSKSTLNTEKYTIASQNVQEKHTNKIKNKINSVRQKPQPAVQILENVVLNPVSLPITTLPKFDLVIPPPPPSQSCTVKAPTNPKTVTKTTNLSAQTTPKLKETNTVSQFKFSNPVVIASNLKKSIMAINNFKFSEPLSKKDSKKDTSCQVVTNFKMPENTSPKVKKKINGDISLIKSAPKLLTGSVMDILGKNNVASMDMFKLPPGTWECSVCMIKNKEEAVRCAACESPKEDKKKTTNGFGSQFAIKSSEWECSVCMIRNKGSNDKCLACQALKPASKPTGTLNNTPCAMFMAKDAPARNKITNPIIVSKPTGTWECNTCMIRNKDDLIKCAACETPKPGQKPTPPPLSSFKPPTSTWECGTCLIRNKDELTKCAACETAKPGATTSATGFGTTFKPSSGTWECNSCLVRNKEADKKCIACETPKPGTTNIGPTLKSSITPFNFGVNTSGFKFGIPEASQSASSKTESTLNAGSIFGGQAKPVSEPAAPASFTFGIKPAETKPVESKPEAAPAKETSSPKAAPTFKFGVVASKSETTKPASTLTVEPIKPLVVNGEVEKNLFLSTPAASTTSTAAPSAVTFSFGSKPAAPIEPVKPSTSLEPKPSLFKFEANKSSDAKPTFGLAAPLTNGVTAAPPTFGAPLNEKAAEKKPFSFGSSGDEPPTKMPFSFSKPAEKLPSSTPAPQVFGFGAAAAAPPAFGSGGSAATPAAFGGFNFSTGNTALNKPAASAQLAAPTSVPSFGSTFGAAPTPAEPPKNGGFNFGAPTNNNTQKAIFSFGAPAQPVGAMSAPKSTGFNFGAAPAVPAASAGGFNFSSSVPVFDANTKPSFNFTGRSNPIQSFSAQPVESPKSQRRVKKAVRRSQR